MTREEVFSKLSEIFKDVFNDDSLEIDESTTAYDIEEWDSVSHVQLIDEIEAEFGVRFNAKEIMSWDDVGEFVDSIVSQLNK